MTTEEYFGQIGKKVYSMNRHTDRNPSTNFKHSFDFFKENKLEGGDYSVDGRRLMNSHKMRTGFPI